MRNLLLVGLPLCLLVAFTPLAHGDWIVLKDGVQFHGKILRQTERELTLKSQSGGILSFRMHQIKTVHRSDPPPKREQPDEKKSSVQYNPDPLLQPVQTRDWSVEGLILTLPVSFVPVKSAEFESQVEGEVLGVFRDPKKGVILSAALGTFPLNTQSFDEMSRRLRQHFVWTEGFDLAKWERRILGGKPTIYTEMTRLNADRSRSHQYLQAWIETAPGKILAVSVVLPEPKFRSDPELYRKLILGARAPHRIAPSPQATARSQPLDPPRRR